MLRFAQHEERLTIQVLKHDRPRLATPEEVMRQIVVAALCSSYGYPADRISLEVVIPMGIRRPRADIVISSEQGKIHTIFEIKAFNQEVAKDQLKSYLLASGAKFGVTVFPEFSKSYEIDREMQLLEITDIPRQNAFFPFQEQLGLIDGGGPGVDIYPVDVVTRISKSHVRLQANGVGVTFKNSDATKLRRVMDAFLDAGLPLNFGKLTPASWAQKISSAIGEASALVPEQVESPAMDFWNVLFDLRTSDGHTLLDLVRSSSANRSDKGLAESSWRDAGVRLIGNSIYFANNIAAPLFDGTKHRNDWRQNLLSLPDASRNNNKPVSFGRKGAAKCVSIRLQLLAENLERICK